MKNGQKSVNKQIRCKQPILLKYIWPFFNITHETFDKNIETTSQKKVSKSFESFSKIPM